MWLTKLRPILVNGLRSKQILRNHETLNKIAVLPVIKWDQRRTYKNFGHKDDPPEHPLQKAYILLFVGLILYNSINWDK